MATQQGDLESRVADIEDGFEMVGNGLEALADTVETISQTAMPVIRALSNFAALQSQLMLHLIAGTRLLQTIDGDSRKAIIHLIDRLEQSPVPEGGEELLFAQTFARNLRALLPSE